MKQSIRLLLALMILALASAYGAAETELILTNSGFEELAPGATWESALSKSPFGWVITYPAGSTAWEIGLTDERVLTGDYALKIATHAPEGGILVSSQPLAIEGDKSYAVLANVYNVEEAPLYRHGINMYIQFWGENTWWKSQDYWSQESWEKQVRGAWNGGLRLGFAFITSQKFGEWDELILIADAPEGTKYMTVDFWTANRTMQTYVDDIRVAVLD